MAVASHRLSADAAPWHPPPLQSAAGSSSSIGLAHTSPSPRTIKTPTGSNGGGSNTQSSQPTPADEFPSMPFGPADQLGGERAGSSRSSSVASAAAAASFMAAPPQAAPQGAQIQQHQVWPNSAAVPRSATSAVGGTSSTQPRWSAFATGPAAAAAAAAATAVATSTPRGAGSQCAPPGPHTPGNSPFQLAQSAATGLSGAASGSQQRARGSGHFQLPAAASLGAVGGGNAMNAGTAGVLTVDEWEDEDEVVYQRVQIPNHVAENEDELIEFMVNLGDGGDGGFYALDEVSGGIVPPISYDSEKTFRRFYRLWKSRDPAAGGIPANVAMMGGAMNASMTSLDSADPAHGTSSHGSPQGPAASGGRPNAAALENGSEGLWGADATVMAKSAPTLHHQQPSADAFPTMPAGAYGGFAPSRRVYYTTTPATLASFVADPSIGEHQHPHGHYHSFSGPAGASRGGHGSDDGRGVAVAAAMAAATPAMTDADETMEADFGDFDEYDEFDSAFGSLDEEERQWIEDQLDAHNTKDEEEDLYF